MKESNNIGIDSVERSKSKKQKWRPYHRDQEKFYELHPPKSTDEWKRLKSLFDKRTGIEREKSNLETEMKRLNHTLKNMDIFLLRMQNGLITGYALLKWRARAIDQAKSEHADVRRDIWKVEGRIQAKEKEIDKLNKSINNEIQKLCGDEISPELASKQKSRKAETAEHIKSLFE